MSETICIFLQKGVNDIITVLVTDVTSNFAPLFIF